MLMLSKVHGTRWPGFDSEGNVVQTSYSKIVVLSYLIYLVKVISVECKAHSIVKGCCEKSHITSKRHALSNG